MRVPTYDESQAAPQELPNVQQQTPFHMMQMADIGPGQQMRLGQAMEGMGSELSHEAIAQQIQDNESAAKNADTAAITSTHAMLFDPDTGFMVRQGSRAVNGFEDFQDKLAEAKSKILSGLQNDAQRQLASGAIEMRFRNALGRATQHAGQQRAVRDMSDSKVRESAAADAAQKSFDPAIDGADPAYHYDMDSGNPADKSAYQTYLHTVMVERQHQAGLAGNTGIEASDEYLRQGLENAYAGIAMNYIATRQPVAAQNFLNAINEKSPGAISATAMNLLRPQLDGAMQQHVVLGTKLELQDANPGDLDAQLQNLDGLHASGKVDDAQFELIQGGLRSNAAFAEQQENTQMAGIIATAQDYLASHPGSSAADLPPVIYNALRASGKLAAMDAFAKRDQN